MPLQISPECRSRWGSVIADLAASFQFPAYNLETLTGYLSIFHGPGSTFRFETEFFKVVLDAVRLDDVILDLAAVAVISKHGEDSRARTGWVIAPRCPIHHGLEAGSEQEKISPNTEKLVWHKVTEGGRRTTYCCDEECKGPFKRGSWKIFDNTRQRIVKKVLEHDNIKLRRRLEQAQPTWHGSNLAQEQSSQRLERNEGANEEVLKSHLRIKELEEECRLLKQEGNKLRESKKLLHQKFSDEAQAAERQSQTVDRATQCEKVLHGLLREATEENRALKDHLRLAKRNEGKWKRELERVQKSLTAISTSLNAQRSTQGSSPQTGRNKANGQPGDRPSPRAPVSESSGAHHQSANKQSRGDKTPNKEQNTSSASGQAPEKMKENKPKRKTREQQSGIRGSQQQNQQHGTSDAAPNKRRRLTQQGPANENHPIVIE